MLYHRRSQRGFTLTLNAVSVVVLLGIGALVVDVGRMYITRAQLQYQCEAAALAGAMELPLSSDKLLRTDSINRATYQAKRCAAAMGLVLNESDVTFPTDSQIRVLHNRSMNFLFARVLGFLAPKVIGASAAVTVGAARVLPSDGFPVGLSYYVVKVIPPGRRIVIYDEDKVTDEYGNIVLQGGARGWLNFNFVYNIADPSRRAFGQQYSASDLRHWVLNGYEYGLYAGSLGGIDGDFINGTSGVTNSAIHEARLKIGCMVWLPVFDYIRNTEYMRNNFPPPSIGWGASSNEYFYHIIGFAAFYIEDVDSSGNDKSFTGWFVRRGIGGSIGGVIFGENVGAGGAMQGSAIVE